MNARAAKEELAILLPNTMSQYLRNTHATMQAADAERHDLLARVGTALRWVAALPRRRAVLEELNTLTDYELADIGLTRADVPHVFDPAFAADHEAAQG
jgi:uncharacterized protein YjiS (DUF1127 family)